jgi:hypothetical protein
VQHHGGFHAGDRRHLGPATLGDRTRRGTVERDEGGQFGLVKLEEPGRHLAGIVEPVAARRVDPGGLEQPLVMVERKALTLRCVMREKSPIGTRTVIPTGSTLP